MSPLFFDPEHDEPRRLFDIDLRPALAGGYEAFELEPWEGSRRLFAVAFENRDDTGRLAQLGHIVLGFGVRPGTGTWVSVETFHHTSGFAAGTPLRQAQSIAMEADWYARVCGVYSERPADALGRTMGRGLEADGFSHLGTNGPVNSYLRVSAAGSPVVVYTIGDMDLPELRVVPCGDIEPYYEGARRSDGIC